MKAQRHLLTTCLTCSLLGCAPALEAPPRGLALSVAPLELVGIDVACYDVLVAGAAGSVWSQGDPATSAAAGDAAICSDVFGNGQGGDISYVGPCDASPDADTDDGQAGVQNSVTIWFDGLYTGSSAGGLTPIPGTTQTLSGTCVNTGYDASSCAFPNLPDWVGMVPWIWCSSDVECTFEAQAPSWQDPCGAAGCTLEFDCIENQDTPVEFSFTVMRNAQQGFFDIAVEFEDVFCSAKYDTCYDVGGPDQRPIELLFGPTGTRDHTGVMGLACAADPNTDAETLLHRSEIWVWCDNWGHYFVLDPAAGPGNVEVAEQTGLFELIALQACEEQACGSATSGSSSAPCGACSDQAAVDQCLALCVPPAVTLRYATYWGTELLDCGSGLGSCNKVYWNIAFDLEHLANQGLTGCSMVSIATASTEGSGTIFDGELAVPQSWYPVIDFGGMDGDWNTGLPLVGATGIPCVAEQLNAVGSLVRTDYAQTGDFGISAGSTDFAGPIQNDYWTWLCFAMHQGDASPVPDPECIARYCDAAANWGGSLPTFCPTPD